MTSALQNSSIAALNGQESPKPIPPLKGTAARLAVVRSGLADFDRLLTNLIEYRNFLIDQAELDPDQVSPEDLYERWSAADDQAQALSDLLQDGELDEPINYPLVGEAAFSGYLRSLDSLEKGEKAVASTPPSTVPQETKKIPAASELVSQLFDACTDTTVALYRLALSACHWRDGKLSDGEFLIILDESRVLGFSVDWYGDFIGCELWDNLKAIATARLAQAEVA